MNYKDYFYINASMMLMAYGFAFEANTTLAIAIAILAVSIAIKTHSIFILKRNITSLCIHCFIAAIVIRSLNLMHIIDEIYVLFVCNEVVAMMWADSSYKTTASIIKELLMICVWIISGLIAIPDVMIANIGNATNAQLCQSIVLIVLLFASYFMYFTKKYVINYVTCATSSRSWYYGSKGFQVNGYDKMVSH